MLDLFTPLCHHMPARASTVLLQPEARIWGQASGLILLCWESWCKCVHRHTALEGEEHFLLGQFMETFLYQISYLMMLWILLVNDIQAPVRISLHKQPNKFSFQNPSEFHQRQQLFNSLGHLNSQRYSKCKLDQKYSVCTLVIPELKLDPQTRALLHAG